MKLLYFDDYKLGVLKGDRVVDVSSAVRDIPHTGPGDLISGLIARFDQYKGKLAGKIVLFGAMREVAPVDKALFERYSEKELEDLGEFPVNANANGLTPAMQARLRERMERLKLLDSRGVHYENHRQWRIQLGQEQFWVAAEDLTDIWGIR